MADAASSAVASAIDNTKTKVTSFFDKAKSKLDAALHSDSETHEKGEDINEKTDLDDVKVPNVFERVKGEIGTLVETASTKSNEITGVVKEKFHSIAGDDKTAEHLKFEEGSTLVINKETHATSSDITEDTPVDAVKAPNIFQRAKEEVVALVQTIHPKKEPATSSPDTEEGGFRAFIAKLVQKICHPWEKKKDDPKSD